jgi:hypothetical protein
MENKKILISVSGWIQVDQDAINLVNGLGKSSNGTEYTAEELIDLLNNSSVFVSNLGECIKKAERNEVELKDFEVKN